MCVRVRVRVRVRVCVCAWYPTDEDQSRSPRLGHEDAPCIKCGEIFADSRAREMFIECSTCKP